MTVHRRLAYTALVLAYAQIVFGAIVRITGSGLGCGDHWPMCMGSWFPPLDRADLIIEITHRYIAAALSVTILLFALTAFRRRAETGVGGRGGVLRPAVVAGVLVVAAALLGAVTVKVNLNPMIVVAHLAIAMTLLATLVIGVVRAGGLGAGAIPAGAVSARTARATMAAVPVAFVVLVLGALTANVPGAAPACQGFPLCNGGFTTHSIEQLIHFVHRIVATVLVLHVIGVVFGIRQRGEHVIVVRAAVIAVGVLVTQIVVAAALVEMHLPRPLQSLHQAVGTAAWLAIVTLAVLARRGAASGATRLARGAGSMASAHRGSAQRAPA